MMNDWQQRVVRERDELNIKIEKLKYHLNTFPDILLSKQLSYMCGYLSILNERINGFKND